MKVKDAAQWRDMETGKEHRMYPVEKSKKDIC